MTTMMGNESMFCGRIKRERDRAIEDRDELAQRCASLTNDVRNAQLERDAARERVAALEQTDREREVLTAKHQPLKHNKHRYQVFDDTGKIVVQQPMNHYRSKDDALVALHRLSAAKIEIED